MKYLKHYWIDIKTGNYISDSNPIEKRHPEAEFPGLDVQIWMHDVDGIDVCLSQVPNDVVINDLVDNVTGKRVVQALTEEEFNSVAIPYFESQVLYVNFENEQDEVIKAEILAAVESKYQNAVTALHSL